jgi:hypothetical protein
MLDVATEGNMGIKKQKTRPVTTIGSSTPKSFLK